MSIKQSGIISFDFIVIALLHHVLAAPRKLDGMISRYRASGHRASTSSAYIHEADDQGSERQECRNCEQSDGGRCIVEELLNVGVIRV